MFKSFYHATFFAFVRLFSRVHFYVLRKILLGQHLSLNVILYFKRPELSFRIRCEKI